MNKQVLINLITSHNNNVAAFKVFCGKLDEINGGGFAPDKWFQLFQLAPPFAKHAGELVKLARAAGINAKYNAQDGEINIYEPEETSNRNETKISVDINNGRVLQLTQEEHDGNIMLCTGDSEVQEQEWTITPGDLVMLMNYYWNCKNGSEKSDYIRMEEKSC